MYPSGGAYGGAKGCRRGAIDHYQRRWTRMAIAAALTIAVIVIPAIPGAPARTALAHCPGGGGTTYASGGKGSITAYGITSSIGWTQGNVCSSGVSHSVTVCNTGSCGGWVQSGWRYYNGYAEPKGYCEFRAVNGTYSLTEYTISHAAHTYRFDIIPAPAGANWACKIDGAVKTSKFTIEMGFGNGTWTVAQGEAHATHVQIGTMAPSKLSFTGLNYINSAGSLIAMNPSVSTSSPYGIDKPSTTQIRMWTNAH